MELREEWRNSRKTMFEEDEIYKENFARLSEAAEDKGCSFSSDRERENKVIGLMAKNFREFVEYFYACKQHHPLDARIDPLCPCDELEQDVEKDGHCFCRLFFKGGDS